MIDAIFPYAAIYQRCVACARRFCFPAQPLLHSTRGRNTVGTVIPQSTAISGHPRDPFVSLLLHPANDGDYRVLTFHLSEGVSDWHTLEGSGFLFNTRISGGVLTFSVAYPMFSNEYSANYLFELWKRIRKYGGYACGITQQIVFYAR